MTLDSHPAYPSDRCYVLKLHRAAEVRGDGLSGRLENLSSGRRFDFGNLEELLSCLAADLSTPSTEE